MTCKDKVPEVLNMSKVTEIIASQLPDQILPSGLSDQRKAYLYNEIREFVADDCRDLVCPLPGSLPTPRKPAASKPAPRQIKNENENVSEDFIDYVKNDNTMGATLFFSK